MSAEPVVVIGSGPSGAAAAAKLVERGVAVLMLDSGVSAPPGLIIRAGGNTIFRKKASTKFKDNRLSADTTDVVWKSSLSHGGLSNIWSAAVPRFGPNDFTDGERLDRRYVWPVRYDELSDYYDEVEGRLTVTCAEPILGVPPPVQHHRARVPADWAEVARHAAENGDGLGAVPMAKGDPWMVAARGSAFASYHCIVKPLLSKPNFTMRAGAHVSRIIWSAKSERAEAVEYEDHETGQLVQVRARAVVVAAGAVDTTMILLRSTSPDFPNGIGNSRDLIGRYLHDHPLEWWPAQTERPMRSLSHPLYLARRNYDDSDPLLATSHTIGLHNTPVARLRMYARKTTQSVGVQVLGTMVPQPEVGISLGRDGGQSVSGSVVSQKPHVSLIHDDMALKNLKSARDRFRDVLGAAGLSVSIARPFDPQAPGWSVHLGGTVRMHDDPEFGVLDRWNRMHDVPNVAVVDMSCFTTGPEKNPTPTAMALATRAADRLALDLA